MKTIRCIAIDDEPVALLIIERFCERRGGMELTVFSEPHSGAEEIARSKPDLVFLDIEMNCASGLEIARTLPPECCLIFTTAHARYALEGFDLDAADFLHKPFSYERFEQAVAKAVRRIEAGQSANEEYIVVKQEYSNISIRLSEIRYIEAMGNYIRILLDNGRHVLSRTSLVRFLRTLPAERFLRIHRSYTVPHDKIEQFSKKTVRLKGCNTLLPVGREFAEALLAALKGSETAPASRTEDTVRIPEKRK